MRKQSYVGPFLKSANMLDGFEDRIHFFDSADILKPYIIESMLNGSHVYITDSATIYDTICQINKAANKTVAKLKDFRKSRQGFTLPSMYHIIDQKNLCFRDPLFSTRSGFIFRKGFGYKAKIDNEVMWLDALGLKSYVYERDRNSFLFCFGMLLNSDMKKWQK